MGYLVNLHHLDITCLPLRQMPRQMCNMKNLETLSQFVLGENDCSSIKELGGLHHLSGELGILNLQNVNDVGDVWEANLKNKKYLDKIAYYWRSNDGAGHDSQKQRNILDALQPHTNTKDLHIQGYAGEQFSRWMGHTSYANLATLTIIQCSNHSLPALGQLPSLQKLSISECQNVKTIGNEFYRESTSKIRPFRSLNSLEFKHMFEWKEWLFLPGQEDGGCFPRLEELYIVSCPKLYVCFTDYFPSLKTLEIEGNKQNGGFLPETQQTDMAFPSFERLRIKNCPGLESFLLGNFPSNMDGLQLSGPISIPLYWHQSSQGLIIIGCEKVMTFPEAHLSTTLTSILIADLPNLKVVNIMDFQHLKSLRKLKIDNCPELRCFAGELLPTSRISPHNSPLRSLKELCLKNLEIRKCEKLQQLPEGMVLPVSLTGLSIDSLPNWKYLCKSVQDLIYLEHLQIANCENLERLAGEDGKGFRHLISLKKLSISMCEKLQWLLEEGLPTSLTSLGVDGFPKLEDLSPMGIQHLVSLEGLHIWDCENLRSLPEEGLPQSLSRLEIWACPLLEARCKRETGADWHKIAHIRRVSIGH